MEWIYPILGKQKCLPFYLSGIGIAEPEYHVIREEGLVSHQLHYTQRPWQSCCWRRDVSVRAGKYVLYGTGDPT